MKQPMVLNNLGYSKNWFEIYKTVSKSYNKISSDTLYIGDSGAAQLFPPNQKANYITTNAGVLMAGQYIIAANVIASNPDLNCIVLIGHPISMSAQFEGSLTFNGFIKPFYERRNLMHFDTALVNKIQRKKFGKYFKYNLLKFFPFSDINYTDDTLKPQKEYTLSDISVSYLKKLEKLCKKNNVSLHILSGPVEKTFYSKTKDWYNLRKQLEQEEMSPMFSKYFSSIRYLEKDYFSDGTHLKTEFLPENRIQIRKYIN